MSRETFTLCERDGTVIRSVLSASIAVDFFLHDHGYTAIIEATDMFLVDKIRLCLNVSKNGKPVEENNKTSIATLNLDKTYLVESKTSFGTSECLEELAERHGEALYQEALHDLEEHFPTAKYLVMPSVEWKALVKEGFYFPDTDPTIIEILFHKFGELPPFILQAHLEGYGSAKHVWNELVRLNINPYETYWGERGKEWMVDLPFAKAWLEIEQRKAGYLANAEF